MNIKDIISKTQENIDKPNSDYCPIGTEESFSGQVIRTALNISKEELTALYGNLFNKLPYNKAFFSLAFKQNSEHKLYKMLQKKGFDITHFISFDKNG